MGVRKLGLGDVSTRETREVLVGRNTAAQRSYSRQSKYDLASRYLEYSWASRRASSGSGLQEKVGGSKVGASASRMGESGSVEKDGLLEVGFGRDTESSAALGIVRHFLFER